jgi:hypothetical protein
MPNPKSEIRNPRQIRSQSEITTKTRRSRRHLDQNFVLFVASWFVLFLWSVLPTIAHAADDQPPPLALDGFPISYWCGPPADFTTIERYREIKDAGFSFVMPPCSGASRELNRKILDLCDEVGLKAFIADGRMPMVISGIEGAESRLNAIVADYSKHPAFLGYFVTDEPATGAFPGLRQVVQYLRQRDPKHPAFINLLPNYATPDQLGAPTYDEYVRQYVQQIRPFAVSWDHYHFLNGSDRPGFVENLSAVRSVALQEHVPFWQIVLAVQHGPYRNLTEGELRYEAMHTLVYGGKGLLWFTYWSPGAVDKSFAWSHAMINPDGTHDPHFEIIRRINSEVRKIGGELLDCESTQVLPPAKGGQPFTTGLFTSKSGEHLAMLASDDYRQPIDAQITVEAEASKISRFEIDRREWVAAGGKAMDGKTTLSLRLHPGGAALLKW